MWHPEKIISVWGGRLRRLRMPFPADGSWGGIVKFPMTLFRFDPTDNHLHPSHPGILTNTSSLSAPSSLFDSMIFFSYLPLCLILKEKEGRFATKREAGSNPRWCSPGNPDTASGTTLWSLHQNLSIRSTGAFPAPSCPLPFPTLLRGGIHHL